MMFRASTLNDIPEIMNIISQAQAYLKAQGVDQWQDGYPNAAAISKDIEDNISFVLVSENCSSIETEAKVIATVAISFHGEKTYDTIYEGNWLSHDSYAVLHRLAVDNSFKGLGIAAEILKYVEKSCTQNKVHSIKIDTHEDNKSMQSFLTKNGFKYCGIIYLESGAKRIAFEKMLK